MPPAPSTRPAAVLILFGVLDAVPAQEASRAVPADLDVLLVRRASTLSHHAGQVAFPGGRVDPEDADAPAAALREAREETGLDATGVSVLGSLAALPVAVSRHLVTPVLAWWDEPSPVRVVDVAESAVVFRAPVADLVAPANRGSAVLTNPPLDVPWPPRRSPAFTLGPHVIWGFTAIVLDRLFGALGWDEPWDLDREVPVQR